MCRAPAQWAQVLQSLDALESEVITLAGFDFMVPSFPGANPRFFSN
jgi:hypothetical protein